MQRGRRISHPPAKSRLRAGLRTLGAGQLDAGLASIAGFFAAALAVRYLTPSQLGVYSLLFLAFGVASQLPTQLIFSPAEVLIAHMPLSDRLGSMRWSLTRGGLVAAASSVTVAAGALPLASEVDLTTVSPLIVSAVAFTLISPIQDHMRRVFHASERSGQAALISATNLVMTGITAAILLQVDHLWVPFGSMTIGNIVSCGAALLLLKGSRQSPAPSTKELVSIGRYLLVVGLGQAGGRYVAGTLVGTIAGSAALGFVEAARLVARPLEVSAQGIVAALGPRLMVASARRDRQAIRGLNRSFVAAALGVGVTYTVLVATPIGWSIPTALFPTAYEISGLVLVTLIAHQIITLTRPLQARLMGLRREVSLARQELVAQAGRLISATTAIWIGAFAIPAGDFVAGGFKLVSYSRTIRSATDGPIADEAATRETADSPASDVD